MRCFFSIFLTFLFAIFQQNVSAFEQCIYLSNFEEQGSVASCCESFVIVWSSIFAVVVL